jgi:hypothetical protein
MASSFFRMLVVANAGAFGTFLGGPIGGAVAMTLAKAALDAASSAPADPAAAPAGADPSDTDTASADFAGD